jgi:hypothetical protein
MAQLYPQAPSTHFSRLLQHAWATVGLFFSPVTTRDYHHHHHCRLQDTGLFTHVTAGTLIILRLKQEIQTDLDKRGRNRELVLNTLSHKRNVWG